MKKFVVLAFIFLINITVCYAGNNKLHSINYNGTKYFLLFSSNEKEHGCFLNEYYKGGETYNNWTDMVAVHHFPNAYSPIDRIKAFKEYLAGNGCPSALTFDDKKNTAMIDFVLINQTSRFTVLEFNIFKYEKSKKCGSVALQYAKRYIATNAMQIDMIKKDFEKQRKKSIKLVKKFNIPDVIYEEIDLCKLPDDELKEIIKEQDTDVKPEQTDSSETAAEENANEISENDKQPEENKNENAKEEEILSPENDTQQAETKEEVVVNTEENTDKESVSENEQKNESDENKAEVSAEETVTEDVKTADETIPAETNDKKKQDTTEQNDTDVTTAPVPKKSNIDESTKDSKKDKNIKEKKSKKAKPQKAKKQKKETPYNITNNKDDFYAKPLTKKEIKQRNKQIKYERSLKAKKDRAKKAEKSLKD